MSEITIKVKSAKEVSERLGLLKGGAFHLHCVNTCYKAMDKFVPYLDGTLRDTAYPDIDGVHYPQIYAGYQYYGIRKDGTHKVENYTTPGTGAYWDRLMVSGDGDRVAKKLQDYIDSGGKA